MTRKLLLSGLLVLVPALTFTQGITFTPGGYIRGGLYLSTHENDYDVNAAFADLSFTLTATDNDRFKAFADLRARFGQQYGENVTVIKPREAWVSWYGSFFTVSAGSRIVKWGRTDIFTPLSRFNPVDYTLRSPDREDNDMGNLLGEIDITPAPWIKLSAVFAPLWNPSVLLIDPIPVPDYFTLDIPYGLHQGNGYHSAGIRTDLTLKGVDFGMQYYRGPDLIPGFRLESFDVSSPMNPLIALKGVPYIINNAGFDFDAVISPFVVRGALSYSKPVMAKEGNEEIPFPQVEWVAGFDWTPGSLRLTAEYSGKRVLDFYESPYKPIIGTQFDPASLLELVSVPGFDLEEYMRLQTEAFNRLYNYQLEEYYHSAGMKMEAVMFHETLIPSVSAMYNFTARDLLLIPSLKYKPADGLTLSAGLEFYSGTEAGLFDIIDNYINAVFFSIKADF